MSRVYVAGRLVCRDGVIATVDENIVMREITQALEMERTNGDSDGLYIARNILPHIAGFFEDYGF
ncbi:hypothetical protein EN935_38410 [Mesorhizobium sp. M7D.F.Ca.US.004.03.1.1]|nr:hypothetical protein EN935_38410 [Mesorhizobium sp. M7D.F.Ca.US.004.03.1.1]